MSHPTRRALLKTGAHAAWAVPAIQVATMAPSFAATSSVAMLSVRVVSSSQSDAGVLTLALSVTSLGADATDVNVNISGSVTAESDVSFGTVSTTKMVSDIKVNLKPDGDGVISLVATGKTSGTTRSATSGAGVAYAKSVLTFGDVTHVRKTDNSGSITVTVRAAWAPAAGVTVNAKNYISNNSGDVTSAAVRVPAGSGVPVTIPIPRFGTSTTDTGARNVAIAVTAGRADSGTGAKITFPTGKSYAVPAGAFPVAALSITDVVHTRGKGSAYSTVTMRFRVTSSLPVSGISWTATGTSLSGQSVTYGSGTAPAITMADGYVDVPDFTFTSYLYGYVKITAKATTEVSGAAATGGTKTVGA